MLEFCSSITMAAYCILSVWLSNGTPVGAVIFQFLYLIIVINTLQRLTRWCLPVGFLRKYAMTVATITSQFVRVFHLVIFFSLILCALLQHLPIIARLYTYFMHSTFIVENDEVYVVHFKNIKKSKLSYLGDDSYCY